MYESLQRSIKLNPDCEIRIPVTIYYCIYDQADNCLQDRHLIVKKTLKKEETSG
jgi:hypothetical protein